MKSHLSSWIDHCKQYASTNNKKYKDCLKDANCRKMYHEQKVSSNGNQPKVKIDLELIKKSIGNHRAR